MTPKHYQISRIASSTWLVVLVLGLSQSSLNASNATGCLPSLRNLFSCLGKSNYAKLAEFLSRETNSSGLRDNTRASLDLLAKDDYNTAKGSEQDFRQLVLNFGSLTSSILDVSSGEPLCGKANLRSLRRVAEAMSLGGNQRPQKVTAPLRRLNRIVIKLVAHARSKCFAHLSNKWMDMTESKTSVGRPTHRMYIQLNDLPKSFLFLTQEAFSKSEKAQTDLGKKLSGLIAMYESLSMALDGDSGLSSPRGLLERYIEKPCEDFMRGMGEPTRTILEPYADLLLTSHIIAPQSSQCQMVKFYESKRERPSLRRVSHKVNLLADAYRYRACEGLKSMDKNSLALLVARDFMKNVQF